MNKICTDIEQSTKLLELGIDVNTADMYWSLVNKNHPPIIGKYCAEYSGMQLPAWSLVALLGLIPTLGYRNPQLVKNIFDNNWRCLYDSTAVDSIIFTQDHDEPVDAAFDMILKLKEKGLL